MSFELESSNDLSIWSPATTELLELVSDGELSTVTLRVTNPGTLDRQFVRVQATELPF